MVMVEEVMVMVKEVMVVMIIDDIDDYDSNNDDDIARTKMKKTSMKIRFFPFRPFFQIFLFLFRSLPGHLRILHHSFLTARKSPFLQLQSLDQSPSSIVVSDTQSDSIQCLNFSKNDSFNIRFNIALPKI